MSSLQPPTGFQRDAPRPYRIRIFNPEYANLDPLLIPWAELRKTPEAFPQYHVAKRNSDRTVIGMTHEDVSGIERRLYIKRSFTTSRWRRIWRPFRATKEWQEMLIAGEFRALGIFVPEPVFYAEADWQDVRYSGPVTFFASLGLPTEFRSVTNYFNQHRSYGDEWAALATLTRNIHNINVLHADYRADHIYLREDNNGGWEWALLDLDGSRVGPSIDRGARIRALRQLTESLIKAGLQRPDLARFLEIYDPEGQWNLRADEIFHYANARNREAPASRTVLG